MSGRRLTTYSARNHRDIARRASTRPASRRDPRLVIGAGIPDPVEVSHAIREWIVPVLVREYLAERAENAACLTTVIVNKLDTEPLGREQRLTPHQANG
jgi:hypothetical protein